ncbi:MAG: hypothetical protein MK193_07570 [Lentisphaeria bacterium]|nr:hypothetical protein [Lentisphaeria bacterium]
MAENQKLNNFLLENHILIRNNPAISPDLTLNFVELQKQIAQEANGLRSSMFSSSDDVFSICGNLEFYHDSELNVMGTTLFYVESILTGDGILIYDGLDDLGFQQTEYVKGLTLIPLIRPNFIHLKNILLEEDPENTLFPVARGQLGRSSLGIGARFTTLHWPAVAWAMTNLQLPLTANQNSIPRELVYDVDAMMDHRLQEIPFPFIGGTVPEGHQGQSVQGMSHASVISFLKYGFHKRGIVHGFNADHQPIGGRFDEIESELVEGSIFASYITYDLSPELTETEIIDNENQLNDTFVKEVDTKVANQVRNDLESFGLTIEDFEFKQLMTYLTPSMKKLKIRDQKYTDIRKKLFTSEIGQKFFKELSIDELPGETTVESMFICLLYAKAMGIHFQYVAPNIGFQKNMPYPNNDDLRKKIDKLFKMAKKLNVSFGFHSGSGKSAKNYQIMGEVTQQALEVKTSGRYTYEMGVALAQSKDDGDQKLWHDWYEFTQKIAINGAFAKNEAQRKFAREFIDASFDFEKSSKDGIYNSPESLEKALNSLPPNPEHMLWFEYNFLYVLAADGNVNNLGDHGVKGYQQRARFYKISDEGKLLFAKQVAKYIIFLAQTTGLQTEEKCQKVQELLNNVKNIKAFYKQI